jgi:hypothetical protein
VKLNKNKQAKTEKIEKKLMEYADEMKELYKKVKVMFERI